jgi:hypothetical protein
MQRGFVIQHELMPELRNKVGALTPKLEHLIHAPERVRIEKFVVRHGEDAGVPNMIAGCWPTPFSRAFAEFADAGLTERTHAALVRDTLGGKLVGHISRDGTAYNQRLGWRCLPA